MCLYGHASPNSQDDYITPAQPWHIGRDRSVTRAGHAGCKAVATRRRGDPVNQASTRVLLACWLGAGVALPAGCTDDPPPPVRPVVSAPVRQLRPGTAVTVTAVVTEVRGDRAFLVADADLPEAGQLVVVSTPVTVVPGDLVTVTGSVAVMDAPALQRFGVDAEFPVVTVVATQVQRYPP
jgi:hypothetical protein